MASWILKGLGTGIRSTGYPARDETKAGVSPGMPLAKGSFTQEQAAEIVARCPTEALVDHDGQITLNPGRCVHCFRCVRGLTKPIAWKQGYEWASMTARESSANTPLGRVFTRSIHILVVDAGDCGACLNEVKQLDNPYYNMHRLGYFITPTPRMADILLVVGALADHMRGPLQKAYDAMPNPKRVMAVGACAISGGIFGVSFACGGAVGELLPVDVEVPGNPPPPLAILHGLLVATGRRPAAVGLSDMVKEGAR